MMASLRLRSGLLGGLNAVFFWFVCLNLEELSWLLLHRSKLEPSCLACLLRVPAEQDPVTHDPRLAPRGRYWYFQNRLHHIFLMHFLNIFQLLWYLLNNDWGSPCHESLRKKIKQKSKPRSFNFCNRCKKVFFSSIQTAMQEEVHCCTVKRFFFSAVPTRFCLWPKMVVWRKCLSSFVL